MDLPAPSKNANLDAFVAYCLTTASSQTCGKPDLLVALERMDNDGKLMDFLRCFCSNFNANTPQLPISQARWENLQHILHYPHSVNESLKSVSSKSEYMNCLFHELFHRLPFDELLVFDEQESAGTLDLLKQYSNWLELLASLVMEANGAASSDQESANNAASSNDWLFGTMAYHLLLNHLISRLWQCKKRSEQSVLSAGDGSNQSDSDSSECRALRQTCRGAELVMLRILNTWQPGRIQLIVRLVEPLIGTLYSFYSKDADFSGGPVAVLSRFLEWPELLNSTATAAAAVHDDSAVNQAALALLKSASDNHEGAMMAQASPCMAMFDLISGYLLSVASKGLDQSLLCLNFANIQRNSPLHKHTVMQWLMLIDMLSSNRSAPLLITKALFQSTADRVKEIPTISQYRTLHESLIDASSGLLSLSSHSEWIAPKLSQFWMDYSLFLDNELSVFHTLWSSISPSVKSAIVFQDFMARMMPNGGIISLLGLIGRAFQNVAAERRIHPLLMTLLLQFPVPHYYAFIAMHFADPLCGVNDGEISKNQTRLISRLVESMEMLVEEESIAQQQIKFRDQIESEPEFRSIVCALPDSSTFAPTSSPSKATIATAFGHKENSATEAIVEMFQLFRTGDPAPLKHYFFPAGDVPVTKLLSADAMSRTFAMLVGCVRRLSWMDMCLWLSGKLSANSLEPSDSAVPLPAAKKLKTNSGASFSAEHSITAKDIFELHTLHAFLLFYRIDDIGWQPSASNSNPLLKKEMLASCPVDSKQRKLQAAINAAAIDWNLMRTKRLGPTLFGHLVRHLVSGLLPKTSDSVSSVLDHVLLGELISATSTKAPLNAGPAHSADNLPRRLDDYLGVLLDKAILAQHYHLYLAGKVKKTPAFRALQDKVARSRLEANTICLRVMIYYIEECDDDGSSRQTTAAEVASKTNGEASINPSSMDHAETTNYHAASLLFTPFGLNVGWAGLRSLTDQRRANLALAIMKFLSHRLMQYLAGERSVQRITKHARLESQTAAATFNYPTQSYHVIVVLLVQIMVFMHGTPLKDSIMSAYVEWLVLEMDKFDQLQALLAEQEGARSSKTAVTVEQFIMDNREPWSLWWLKSGTFGMLDTEGEGEGGSVSVHPLQIAEHIVGNVNMARDFLGMSRFISQLTTVYLLRRMDKRATPALILTGEHRLLRGRRYCGWLMGMYFCHYLLINVHRLAAQRKPKDYAPTAASASASSSSLASSSSTISSTTTAASAAASKLPSTDISLNGDATPRDICRFVTDNFANPEAHNPELSRLLRMLIIAARDEVANNQGSGDGVALMDSSQLPIVLMELLTAVRCFSETTMSTDTEQYRRRPFRSYAHRLSSVRRRFPFYCSLWFVTYFIGALVEGFEELAAPSMTSNNPKYFSLSQLIKELFTNDGWWTYLFPDMQQPAKSFGNDLQTEREQDPKYLNPNLYWLLMKISTLEAQYPDGCRLFFECWFDAWTAPFAVNDSSTASGADEPRVANVLVARILLLVDFYQYPGASSECFDYFVRRMLSAGILSISSRVVGVTNFASAANNFIIPLLDRCFSSCGGPHPIMPFLVNQVAIGLGDEADQIGVIRKLVERHIGRLADKLLLVVRPVCSASTQKLSISPREAEAESQIYELLNQPIINFQQHLQALGWLTQPIQMLETIAVLQRTRPEDLGVAQDNLPDFSSGLSVDSIDPWAVFDCLLPVAQRNLLLHGWLNVQQESRLARKQMLSEQLSIVVVDQIRSLLTIADEFYARLDFQVPAIIELAHLTEPLLYV